VFNYVIILVVMSSLRVLSLVLTRRSLLLKNAHSRSGRLCWSRPVSNSCKTTFLSRPLSYGQAAKSSTSSSSSEGESNEVQNWTDDTLVSKQSESVEEEDDEEALPPMRSLTYRETDFVGFDKKNIRQEPDEERAHFRDLVNTYGEHLVARPNDMWPEREYTITEEDNEEWRHVEALLPNKLVPPVPVKDEYPSGFRPPTAKPGDYPYYVSRTANHMLPVYSNMNMTTKVLSTVVRLADGDLFALRNDLKAFLFDRYQMDFMSQVAEVYGRVLFRGDFEDDFKEFLLQKGF